MTLVVSLRIPDGLVLAADSLLSIPTQIEVSTGFQTKCPKCQSEIDLKEIKMPPILVPGTTSSFSQKLFSFKEKFGVGTHGTGTLANKTIYYQVKELELSIGDIEIKGVSDAAQIILNHFDKEIRKEIKDIDKAPDDFWPLGFQVVGYDGNQGKTIEVKIGKKSVINKYESIGCTVSGDNFLVVHMWELGKRDPRRAAMYPRFSLQDAIDYAEFLISTTATYQRFANIMPSVGGEIDIALITPFHNFRWIKCKSLTKVLELGSGTR